MNNGKWNAMAEAAMMGIVVKVENDDHLKYMVAYVLKTLASETSEVTAEEVVADAYKYNSDEAKVTHFTINKLEDDIILTFVRDKEMTDLTSDNGVLAYVYNLSCSWCSELGYVFIKKRQGVLRRIG